jgi:hypothetical protein
MSSDNDAAGVMSFPSANKASAQTNLRRGIKPDFANKMGCGAKLRRRLPPLRAIFIL